MLIDLEGVIEKITIVLYLRPVSLLYRRLNNCEAVELKLFRIIYKFE